MNRAQIFDAFIAEVRAAMDEKPHPVNARAGIDNVIRSQCANLVAARYTADRLAVIARMVATVIGGAL